MEWQPIETIPKDGTTVLVCGFGYKGYFVADAQESRGKVLLFDPVADEFIHETQATHWMPLPEPPESA